ncbi:MAG: tail fiber domain-containing protein [Thermomicrobiales bacterium]
MLQANNGAERLRLNGDEADNTALGAQALSSSTSGGLNTAIGVRALSRNTIGFSNTAVGRNALSRNTTGNANTALGSGALFGNFDGSGSTAVGQAALLATTFSNTTGLVANSVVTGDNQVWLGGPGTTSHAHAPLQVPSDRRDKADVRDTVLGLEFITALRPVDYRWDARLDYRPAPPEAPAADASAAERVAYQRKLAAWAEASRLGNLTHDGSKRRTRFHHGLIAQEVAELIGRTGVDFGGYQDHTVNGGGDVLTLGYDELIAPLVKAVQELAARNEDLAAENSRILERVAALEAAHVG